MDDQALIKKAVNGDKNAFEALLQEIYDPMFKMAFKYCGNRQDAEDITQDACVKLARHIGSFRFKSAFSSWVFRMVINCANDFYRARKPETALENKHLCAAKADAETNTYAGEILAQVRTLPENEKTALLLVLSEGFTHAEAADIMDCKESTVSWYIHEARKKLGVKEAKERSHG
ncbi:MAG: RNA polymerase sigma factor [Rhodospirillales bacterium]|nr:RNA polymerase sigma factor [Rhodospirillales bacterium]MCB9994937.1 RNA polymerase sigma factor [Rhodospirillales bacterium]